MRELHELHEVVCVFLLFQDLFGHTFNQYCLSKSNIQCGTKLLFQCEPVAVHGAEDYSLRGRHSFYVKSAHYMET